MSLRLRLRLRVRIDDDADIVNNSKINRKDAKSAKKREICIHLGVLRAFELSFLTASYGLCI